MRLPLAGSRAAAGRVAEGLRRRVAGLHRSVLNPSVTVQRMSESESASASAADAAGLAVDGSAPEQGSGPAPESIAGPAADSVARIDSARERLRARIEPRDEDGSG